MPGASSIQPTPSFDSFPDIDSSAPSSRKKPFHERTSHGRTEEPRTSFYSHGERAKLDKDDRRSEAYGAERDERWKKEEKRRRDRGRAEALVKGEKRKREDERDIQAKRGEGPANGLERGLDLDDGVPWYEAFGQGRSRSGYEEPFDPVSGQTSAL